MIGCPSAANPIYEANGLASSAAPRSDTSYGYWYDCSDDNRDDKCSPDDGRYGPILGVSCPVTHSAWSWQSGGRGHAVVAAACW